MLQFEIIDEFGRPQVIRGARVLIRDCTTASPIGVAAVTGHGMVEVSTAAQPDFNQVLRQLGIRESILMTQLSPKDLPPISIG